MFLYARTIHGLPGKIGNANTKPRPKGRGFFLPKSVHRTLFIRQDNTLACLGQIRNANTRTSYESRRLFLAEICHRHCEMKWTIFDHLEQLSIKDMNPVSRVAYFLRNIETCIFEW